MSLSESDKAQVKALWGKMSGQADKAMRRMFVEDPASKTAYPPDFDFKPGSEDIRAQSMMVVAMLSNAVAHIDNLDGAQELRALLACKLLDELAFDESVVVNNDSLDAWDRFLDRVAAGFLRGAVQ